ncbi:MULTISPECIES: MFS transporter [Pseudomonas chlororaphis group]|uniref:MFS transporter n=1 Tax=Pseudomonas chlororaphis group TaxID=136842 RepID=UPI000D9F40C4|nr:MFS transporter [Pseudomonas protegens]MCY7259643.1 MFS transporter [Pseudomonas protegens]PYC04734.1 MFS transporter [Pseudomonas protegens]
MASTSGWSALLLGKNGLRSAALAGGVALHAINVYLVTTLLPSVVKDIGGLDYYAWNTTLFVVASIIGSVLSTRALGILGPKLAYALAGLVFMLGCGLCALAPDMGWLIIGRSVQGLGGGLLFALPYAMIRLVFDEPLWPRAMALISAMWGAATLIGPAVGGVFAEHGAWRAAFWVLLPCTLLFMLLAIALLPGKSRETAPRSPIPGLQLVLLTAVVLAISIGSITPSPGYNALGLGVGLGLLLLVVVLENRSGKRLLPRDSLKSGSPLLALYLSMALLVVGMTSEVFVPLFLQELHQQTPLLAGYIAALMAAGWTLGAIFSSGLSPRGAARAIASGPFLVVAGLLLACLFMPATATPLLSLGAVCLAMLLVGTGIGLAWPHLLSRVLENAADDQKELAGASITTVQLVATALGAALAGMIVNLAGLSSSAGVAGTAQAAAWLFGLYAGVSALLFISMRQVRRHHTRALAEA